MGNTNFVGSLVAEALATKQVRFRTALASAKDYIWIDDVAAGLALIAQHGRQPVYNLAGGANLSNDALAALFAQRGIGIEVAEGVPMTSFPEIRIDRLSADTGFQPCPVMPRLAVWLDAELAVDSAPRYTRS
jgi:nucleoside-diphosphate-sugar epimerase